MEFLVATSIALLTAGGVYLSLRGRTFQVVLGLTLLSYAVNLFLFAVGRLVVDRPPLFVKTVTEHADPLPQALVLTAIVITFGMTALVVILSLRSFLESGSDQVDGIADASPLDRESEDVL
ncbi:Na+/H+ antiporter subunit C [Sphingobium sp. BS19]|uniref:Na+/H+ antiporter subunit C n=1 Tax=Sphingobium sp. BS19 TaxID=3018973 RepID=UPI0035CF2444